MSPRQGLSEGHNSVTVNNLMSTLHLARSSSLVQCPGRHAYLYGYVACVFEITILYARSMNA